MTFPIMIEKRIETGYKNGVYYFTCPLCELKDSNLSSSYLATEAMRHIHNGHLVKSEKTQLFIMHEDEQLEGGVWCVYTYDVGPVLIEVHGTLIQAVYALAGSGYYLCWLRYGQELNQAINEWDERRTSARSSL